LSIGRRLWERRHGPVQANRAPLSSARIGMVVKLVTSIAIASAGTSLLISASPLATVPITFHGPYFVAEFVPLAVFMRLLGQLCAIMLVPDLMAWVIVRRVVGPVPLAIAAAVGAVVFSGQALAHFQAAGALPHGFTLSVLDVLVCLTCCLAGIDAIDAARAND
jgi:hypothetical protein